MSDTTQPAPRTLPNLEQMHAHHLHLKVGDIAEKLRRMAARIENEADFLLDPSRETVSYSQLTQRVVHEITWGVANLDMASLIAHGTDADLARAEAKGDAQ